MPVAQYDFAHRPSHSIHVGSPTVNVDVKTTREHVTHNQEMKKVKNNMEQDDNITFVMHVKYL